MKILVTGGAGFIGSHVVDTLVSAGHEVAVVDNLKSGKRENLNSKAKFYEVDIRNREALARVFAEGKFDAISHQAALASVRGSFREPAEYADVNLIGSINLLELARAHSVKRVVYASTGGAVYGEPEFLPVTELHPVNPLDPYGASKHAVEHYLFIYERQYGLGYTSLRYPNVYGPHQDPFGEAGVVAIFTERMLKGEVPTINGTGQQERDYTYVGDIARGNLLALQSNANGICNLGTSKGTDLNTLTNLIKEATHYRGEIKYGPAKKGEVFKTCLDASQAKKMLGWEPQVSLEEGVRRTVEWFHQRQE